MRRRSFDYHYKTFDIGESTSLDKKRYEYLNEYGFNIDSNKKRIIDYDAQFKRVRLKKTK